jgi:hypothetical protein
MKAIRKIGIIIVLAVFLPACVERYYPEDADSFTGILVVNANLTNESGIQTINLSRSDGLVFPEHRPEPGAAVQVENERGDVISFTESGDGNYLADIPEDFLREGGSYRLLLVTSDGNRYESEFTTLHPASTIDSVYYRVETAPGDEPGTTLEGIRFYMDFIVDPESDQFLMWDLTETYEFHNPPYEGFIYGLDRILKPLPDSMSDRECWITRHIPEIFTLETGNLTAGRYSMKPLHFVSNQTQRLRYGYSLLVRQLSLDEAAFRYWNDLKKNVQESGALFDTQPSIAPGNICNCSDPEEKVLGFFSVSAASEKRIFVQDVEGLDVPDRLFCFPTFEFPRLNYFRLRDLPIFLARGTWPETGEIITGETKQECLDCRLYLGSSGEPPDFWPE